MMPARMPTKKQMPIAVSISEVEIYTGKSNWPERIFVSPNTISKPIIPPIKQRNAASNKNSIRMIRLLAPIAFFNPIWLVLSFTLTNMILATPNNPTIKLMPPIIAPPILIPENAWLNASLQSFTSFKEKLSSCVGLCWPTGTPCRVTQRGWPGPASCWAGRRANAPGAYVFTGYRMCSAADEPVVEFSRADGRADVVYPEGAAAGSRLGGKVLSIQARTAECR